VLETLFILLVVTLFFLSACANNIIMKMTTAQRKRAKIRLLIQDPGDSGKTFSSLLIAKGLVGTWENICVID
jgi:hypothetical protein